MKMTEWFLAELESEAAKSRRVLEQVPTGKRDWSRTRGRWSSLPVRAGRDHTVVVGRHHAGRAGYRAERRTEVQTGSMNTSAGSLRRSTRPLPRRARRCRATDATLETPCAPRRWSSRVRAAASQVIAILSALRSHRGQMTVYLRCLARRYLQCMSDGDDRSFG